MLVTRSNVETSTTSTSDSDSQATLSTGNISAPVAMHPEQLRALIGDLVSASRPPQETPLPEFHGFDHEDITEFLGVCEGRLENTPPEERLLLVAGRLRGAAEVWWKKRRDVTATYPQFRRAIQREFDSDARFVQVRAELWSRRQGPKEVVESTS